VQLRDVCTCSKHCMYYVVCVVCASVVCISFFVCMSFACFVYVVCMLLCVVCMLCVCSVHNMRMLRDGVCML